MSTYIVPDDEGYLKALGIETDVWLSVATGGERGQTISLRVARAEADGSRPACWVCAYLSRMVEKDHCRKQRAGIAISPHAALLAGLQLGLAMVLVWAALLHIPDWIWSAIAAALSW